MTRRRIFRLPLWLKFLLIIVVAGVLLALPASVVLRAGIYELGLQSARLFVSESGSQRVEAVANGVRSASQGLTLFANEESNERLFHALLIGESINREQYGLPNVRPADLARLFRTTLLNPATSIYDFVRLVGRDGEVVAQSSLVPGAVLAGDVSSTPTFLAALNASLQGQDRSLTISSQGDENAAIEAVELIRWRDGSVIGFLIARFNYDRIISANLTLPEPVTTSGQDIQLDGLIFLTTSQGAVLSASADRAEAEAARGTLPALRGLGGQRGVATFRRAAASSEIVAFYAPVPGTPLALVAQTNAEDAYNAALAYFNVRVFVVAVGSLSLIAIMVLLFNQLVVPSINRLRGAAQALAAGDFNIPVPDTRRGDEIGALASSFVSMRDALRQLIAEQEARTAERTRDFAATQEIGRFATTQRDLQRLMDSVVDLIIDRFPNIYHAQIFLLDADRAYAVLRSSTGDAGRMLLSRGHRLAVGSVSVIGQATGQGRTITARDTAASPVHRRNELLPDTRAELAIPLRVGDSVIGALDVQSRYGNAFNEEQIAVLQAMADQIAIAIENARLYEESLRRAAEIEQSNRQATLRVWTEFMRAQRSMTVQREAGVPLQHDHSELRQRAQHEGRAVVGAQTERGTIPVAVPIILRGQTLGAVEWELPAQGFGEDKLELAQELGARLAVSLDNARLFQESRQAVERERLVNSIAGRLASQTTLDDLLKTAVREVGQAVRAPAVGIRLGGSLGGSAAAADANESK
jgi:GAF domain-containing protein/HAMP domain-containing protein